MSPITLTSAIGPQNSTEVYSEPCQTCKVALFAKKVQAVNYYCQKSSVIDALPGPKYASDIS